MQKISWTDHVRNGEVLNGFKERSILHAIKRRKANWIGNVFRRNFLLKHITEGKIEEGIEVAERQRRRCRQLINDFKKTGGYWKLKEKALARTLWRTRFGRDNGPAVRQVME